MISKTIKTEIFNRLLETQHFFQSNQGSGDILYFLNLIWPLRDMPSTDSRFPNAYQDAMQHLINNDDWTIEFTFLDRFKLIDGEEQDFVRFIEAVLSPSVRKSKDEILKYYQIITPFLRTTDVRLAIVDYFEELPVYKIVDKQAANDLPQDIPINNIRFYKSSSSNTIPTSSFYLTYNNWDDYNYKTTVKLYYRGADNFNTYIGVLKILNREAIKTWDILPDSFTALDSSYCSLGVDIEFYEKVRIVFPQIYRSILLALRDAALFPRIAEEFENEEGFRKSLLRSNDAEYCLRTVRFHFAEIRMEERFKFTYRFRPPYADDLLNFNFDFEYSDDTEHRIYAIIGKNGSGKTKLLSSLAHELSQSDTTNISPRKPLFGKIITVSYSYFDSFEIPSGDALFNYAYCGLKKNDGTWFSQDELLQRFYEAVEKIMYKGISNDWYEMLKTFLPGEIIAEMFLVKRNHAKLVEGAFARIQNKLSSGQRIQVYIITEILASIRSESLILYDEPETHLHPNAISILANTLFKLAEKFDSFCIIATHSPLLIQELYSRNVFVVERIENTASLRLLERECFAENLTVITDDIFGNRQIDRHYLEIIKELVNEKKDFQAIVDALQGNELPLNLNTRLYIKSLLKELR